MTSHQTGTVYFMVSYLDDDSLVPVMETVVYLGQQQSEDAEVTHLFQDFESWKEGGEYPNTSEGPGKVFSLPPTELSNIQPLRRALEELGTCLARRMKRGID